MIKTYAAQTVQKLKQEVSGHLELTRDLLKLETKIKEVIHQERCEALGISVESANEWRILKAELKLAHQKQKELLNVVKGIYPDYQKSSAQQSMHWNKIRINEMRSSQNLMTIKFNKKAA